MKNALHLKVVLVSISLLAFLSVNKSFSQTPKEKKKIEHAAAIKTAVVDSQHYVFRAQTAIPAQEMVRNLTYGYEVVVSSKKIDSYLPYFGVAYTADYGATSSPLEFISSNFSYSMANGKKSGWNISIQTNDTKDFKKLFLSIFENGTATLQVVGSDRQPISFNGIVEPVNEEKK